MFAREMMLSGCRASTSVMCSTTCEEVCGHMEGNSIINKKGDVEEDIDFKVKPADLKGDGVVKQSSIYQMTLPMLWIMWMSGRFFYSLENGWMKSSFKSLPFAYAFFIVMLNFTMHGYYNEHLKHALFDLTEAITFSRMLFSALIILQSIGVWMTLFSLICETPSVVRNYNTTAVLERKLSRLMPIGVLKPMTRKIIAILLGLYFVGLIITTLLLLVTRYRNEPIPVLVTFSFNFVGNQTHTVMWCVNNLFIRTLAIQLGNHMIESMRTGGNRAHKLRMCRKAWLSIWEQSMSNTDAFSSTVVWAMLGYSVTFVTSTYGLIVSLRNFDEDEIIGIMPYFLATLSMVFIIIESAHQAKHKLGDEFLFNMIHLDKDTMDSECLMEVEKFTNVIMLTDKAQFTLKGYFIIGRPLFVSFLSYTVTYLIVLLQFKQSEERVASPQGSQNVTH